MPEQNYDLTADNVTIFGRTLSIAGALWLGYSGSGVAFVTDASVVKADVLGVSTTNAVTDFAYLGVFVDHALQMIKRFEVRRDLHTYELYRNTDGGSHVIQLVKLTETKCDKVALSVIRADAPIQPEPEENIRPADAVPLQGGDAWLPSRRILFIGDSLTAGYGLLGDHSLYEDPAAYIFTTRQEDVTKTFAWQCARLLGAQAQYFCWSGNGVITHYVAPDSEVPITEELMPSLLPYVDKEMENVAKIYLRAHGWKDPAGLGGLTTLEMTEEGTGSVENRSDHFVPDLIVSNLGTNDASFTRGIPVREQHFGQKYLEMLRQAQRIYPDAQVLLAYGMVETSLSDICNQVALMGNFQYQQLPLMDPPTEGIGGGGHPGIATHRLAAEVLATKIREMMDWEWPKPGTSQ